MKSKVIYYSCYGDGGTIVTGQEESAHVALQEKFIHQRVCISCTCLPFICDKPYPQLIIRKTIFVATHFAFQHQSEQIFVLIWYGRGALLLNLLPLLFNNPVQQKQ